REPGRRLLRRAGGGGLRIVREGDEGVEDVQGLGLDRVDELDLIGGLAVFIRRFISIRRRRLDRGGGGGGGLRGVGFRVLRFAFLKLGTVGRLGVGGRLGIGGLLVGFLVGHELQLGLVHVLERDDVGLFAGLFQLGARGRALVAAGLVVVDLF